MSAPVSASHHDPTAIEALLDRKQPGVRAVPLDLVQHWLPGNPELRLLVLIGPTDEGPRLLISDRPDRAQTGLDSGADPATLSRMLETPLLDPDAPLSLQPAVIAKPWGRELWHTGIEARGVSRVGGAAREEGIPLPWLLAALPGRYGARDPRQLPGDPVRIRPPVLVKILDPHSDPQLGDLYFELHEHKQEVYLVTGVDPDAWPEGRGAIRMGFDPALVRQLGDAGVRRAFAEAVAAYEPVRRRIDALLDARRGRAGIEGDATLPPATQRAWLAELPQPLLAEERRCRRAVETLTALEPLAPGDPGADSSPGSPCSPARGQGGGVPDSGVRAQHPLLRPEGADPGSLGHAGRRGADATAASAPGTATAAGSLARRPGGAGRRLRRLPGAASPAAGRRPLPAPRCSPCGGDGHPRDPVAGGDEDPPGEQLPDSGLRPDIAPRRRRPWRPVPDRPAGRVLISGQFREFGSATADHDLPTAAGAAMIGRSPGGGHR
ncbi:MAG: hypothetical protein U5R48_10755 [Gammaproteobacteria bacterium]|nr:hypothetical protein [Gammaproteobacteria bacterium]